jgi:hypothetical protein
MHRGDDVVAGWCGIDKHQKNKREEEREKRVWLLM